MTVNRIRERIVEIMSTVLETEVTPEQNLTRELCAAWDSLKHMELILALEEEFGIRFTLEQATELHDMNGILSIIEGRIT